MPEKEAQSEEEAWEEQQREHAAWAAAQPNLNLVPLTPVGADARGPDDRLVAECEIDVGVARLLAWRRLEYFGVTASVTHYDLVVQRYGDEQWYRHEPTSESEAALLDTSAFSLTAWLIQSIGARPQNADEVITPGPPPRPCDSIEEAIYAGGLLQVT